MALERSYLRKLALSLFDKEASYNAGPAGWTGSSACLMQDHNEESGAEVWDDTIQSDTDVVTGHEFRSVQEIVRQGMRLTYTEPRAKPNTLAGLMALCMGTVTATQDGVLTAYRHKITPATSVSLPSIGAQTLREGGVQRKYHGIKGEQFTLSHNGAYWQFVCQMIGSGHRATASDSFPAVVSENWQRWGSSAIYIKDTGGTPIDTSFGTPPSQSAANLGGSETNLSTRVIDFTWTWNNNLQAEQGYRASMGQVRTNFHPLRRTSNLTIRFEVDSADEAADLNYYLNQSKLAIELNVNSGTVVAATGTFNYGFIVLLPRVQLTSIPRSQTAELENLDFIGEVLDDGTNPAAMVFVYTAKAVYLA
jgi:hypothetical protein